MIQFCWIFVLCNAIGFLLKHLGFILKPCARSRAFGEDRWSEENGCVEPQTPRRKQKNLRQRICRSDNRCTLFVARMLPWSMMQRMAYAGLLLRALFHQFVYSQLHGSGQTRARCSLAFLQVWSVSNILRTAPPRERPTARGRDVRIQLAVTATQYAHLDEMTEYNISVHLLIEWHTVL